MPFSKAPHFDKSTVNFEMFTRSSTDNQFNPYATVSLFGQYKMLQKT